MNRTWATALLALALAAGASRESWAWGATGHEWISGIAIEKLPDRLPDFVRTTEERHHKSSQAIWSAMQANGVGSIASNDSDIDRVPKISRYAPT